MNDLMQIAIIFIVYIVIILLIACIGKYVTKNLADYILAGRKLSGPVTALGAGASDMSSWLTMALPGLIYVNGLSMIWMPIALLIGAWSNWIFIAKRLRIYTEIANNSLTLPSYFHNRFQDNNKVLRLVTSLACIIFFTCYASAGFMSGAILLESIFGLRYQSALILSSIVIISYTTIGGFLAVNWIDFFQGSLMFIALLIVPIVTLKYLGGVGPVVLMANKFFPQHLDIFSNVKILSLVSLFAWGLGYFGQPHINVRFMAIKTINDLPIARRICMGWMLLSLVGAIGTGLLGAIFYLPEILHSPETVFIALSRALFNPWFAGVLLSAVLASIMSTVSAQILITASTIVEDFYHSLWQKIYGHKPSDKQCLLVSKFILIIIAVIAVIIAVNPKTILHAVAFAWSGLGAAFGPTILCSLYWRKMNLPAAVMGILVGMLTVILGQKLVYHSDLLPGFMILPGFLLSVIAILITGKLTKAPSAAVLEKFDIMVKRAK